jgi:hypothetical protein
MMNATHEHHNKTPNELAEKEREITRECVVNGLRRDGERWDECQDRQRKEGER